MNKIKATFHLLDLRTQNYNVSLLRHLSIASDVHFAKFESSTVVSEMQVKQTDIVHFMEGINIFIVFLFSLGGRTVLLEGEISIDWSEGLALWRPVGKKFNYPRHTAVSLQLVLDTQKHTQFSIMNITVCSWRRAKLLLYYFSLLLTSMVLSLKYLMYSGPM